MQKEQNIQLLSETIVSGFSMFELLMDSLSNKQNPSHEVLKKMED